MTAVWKQERYWALWASGSRAAGRSLSVLAQLQQHWWVVGGITEAFEQWGVFQPSFLQQQALKQSQHQAAPTAAVSTVCFYRTPQPQQLSARFQLVHSRYGFSITIHLDTQTNKNHHLCLSALYELVSSSKSLPFISISVFSTLYTSATMVLEWKEHNH